MNGFQSGLLAAGVLALAAAAGVGQSDGQDDSGERLPAAAFLAALPDGEAKQRFILDCTGCHTFREAIAYPGGEPRTRDAWHTAATRMLAMAGAATPFPVIGPGRTADATADWLAKAVPPRSAVKWSWPTELAGRADIREYEIPAAQDLPHDVAIVGDQILITGMFTSRMYLLDPETGTIRTENTPQPNPRAVEVDEAGNWWVVLGAPHLLARRSPSGEWRTYDAGFYAHSVAIAPNGTPWVNGHFTHNPELLRSIDPATGARRDYVIPPHPEFTSTTVPYEIRVGSDGMVWMSELQGNRLVRYNPARDEFQTWMMPTKWSGPRRLDVDPSGIVWIPEYSANKLARFDPKTETFEEYELPVPATAPYIARWDERRGVVWIGTGAADALFSFNPKSKRFTYYRLPAPGSLVRHLVIDARNGDVWLAPGESPGISAARVVRVRPQ